MAKIKPVLCPQCGSPDCVSMGDNKYVCKNCNTIYFIDDEKIEIIVKHQFENKYPSAPAYHRPAVSKSSIVGLFIFIVVVFGFVFASGFLGKKGFSTKKGYAEKICPAFYQGKPVVLTFFRTWGFSTSDTKENTLTLSISDLNKKIIKEQKINYLSDKSSRGIDVRSFANSELWFIINERQIFQIDKKTLEAKEVTGELISKYPELKTGFAKANFIYNGEGIKITTNQADELFLYPLIEKIYTENADRAISTGGLTGTEKFQNRYAFSSTTNNKQYLYIYECMYYENGPNRKLFPNAPDYPIKQEKNDRYHKASNIRLLFPKRVFFDAEILFQGNDFVIVGYKPDITNTSNYIIQKIDKTGDIIWTCPDISFENRALRHVDVSLYENEVFGFSSSNWGLFIDDTGKLLLNEKTKNF